MPLRIDNRYLRIGIATALMATFVFVAGSSIYGDRRQAILTPSVQETPYLPFEAGMFERAGNALAYLETPDVGNTKRSLKQFYSRRAFPGAPPAVPHPLADPTAYGGSACTSCHSDGGWVEKWEAWAPVTPHPSWENCLQCHVPSVGKGVFRASTFQPAPPPPVNQRAFPGAPPAVPHEFQMRENCLACHAGPGAVNELRTTHPERVGCRQCHASVAAPVQAFQRPLDGGVAE